MKYDITVLVPGIRPLNWLKLYNSVNEAFSGTWEMIFISPYPLPYELKDKDNIVLIEDWGTPIRCQQRGLTEAKGDFITWAADDGFYIPNALNVSFNLLKDLSHMNVVTGKYEEGYDAANMEVMAGWQYYHLKYHASTKHEFVPDKALILNVGLIPRQLLFDVGGWDCQFEVCPMSYSDLSVRLNHYGVNFIKQEGIMFKCGHMPGHTGDHGPIHDAQIDGDEPLFKKIYSSPESKDKIKIDLDNWKQSPERWERRFGKN